jgi:hypothetical protein
MAAYGDAGSPSSYEYDHLVSLELGGATNDPRNLWPEPGASPNVKDAVEDSLHAKVCDGRMLLRDAQHLIATAWVRLVRSTAPTKTAPSRSVSPPAPAARTGSGPLVHPGSYCSPEGARGVTVDGTPMTCRTSAADSRDRWRRS